METLPLAPAPARQLHRHPLCLAPPLSLGAAFLGASVALRTLAPALLDHPLGMLLFAAVELQIFWRWFLLPFLAWRAFSLRILADRVEVALLEGWRLVRRQHHLYAATLSLDQELWEAPLKTGTLTIQTGTTTVRYSMLTPIEARGRFR